MRAPDAACPTPVLISVSTLVAGAMGGSEVYARELIAALQRRNDVQLRVVAPRTDVLASTEGSTGVTTLPGSSSAARLTTQMLVQYSARARAAARSSAVIHYPLQVQTPSAPGACRLLTVHDVQHLDMPHLFGRAERIYRRFRYDLPARDTDGIITISQFSKARIVHRLGLTPGLVHVIPLGHDIPPQTEPREREDFVLYPANAWPHKNHARLIEAVKLLRTRRPGVRLVLTGAHASLFSDAPHWVESKGRVSREELLALYRAALCVAIPSLYEGFGLPALEALASGTPVAAAAIGALKEVCGEAATYFDPYDPREMSRAIEQAIDSGDDLGRLGLARSTNFTWGRSAERHAETYAWALRKKRRPASCRC